MKPREIAKLWRDHVGVAVFSAKITGDRRHLTVHPFKEGGGFLCVIWGEYEDREGVMSDQINAGGRCRARDRDAAIIEATKRLTKEARA